MQALPTLFNVIIYFTYAIAEIDRHHNAENAANIGVDNVSSIEGLGGKIIGMYAGAATLAGF